MTTCLILQQESFLGTLGIKWEYTFRMGFSIDVQDGIVYTHLHIGVIYSSQSTNQHRFWKNLDLMKVWQTELRIEPETLMVWDSNTVPLCPIIPYLSSDLAHIWTLFTSLYTVLPAIHFLNILYIYFPPMLIQINPFYLFLLYFFAIYSTPTPNI